MKIAIYPGSFDPITLGHLDIIRRGAACFDKLYVCVMVNCEKKLPMFTPERRLELIRRSVADIPNVEVENWSGLLQMARINQGIEPELETLLLPARAEFEHFSSTMAREMIRYGQPLEKYVPAPIAEELEKMRG